jgi:hypothetical protein
MCMLWARNQEPWLNYIMSLEYTDQSRPIVESNRLLGACQEQGAVAERLFGVGVRYAWTDGVSQRRQQLVFLHYGKPLLNEFLHNLNESVGWSVWCPDDCSQGFEILFRKAFFLSSESRLPSPHS